MGAAASDMILFRLVMTRMVVWLLLDNRSPVGKKTSKLCDISFLNSRVCVPALVCLGKCCIVHILRIMLIFHGINMLV